MATNTNTRQVTQYFYDADGNRVKRIGPQGATVYVSADYEVTRPSQMVTPTYAHKLYFPLMACASNNGSGIPSLGIPPLNLPSNLPKLGKAQVQYNRRTLFRKEILNETGLPLSVH